VPFESRYYAPYNTLLDYALRDVPFTFPVAPLKAPPDDIFPYEEVPVYCLVVSNLEQKPVLFVDIKDDSWANEPYRRVLADFQIRKRYDQLMFNCPIPRLYGLSVLGTSLRVYCGDKATEQLTPDFVDRPNVLPSNFLEGEWGLDILSPDGLKKMQDIFAYIKAEALNDTRE
jgi:hypothetical protein